MNPLIRIVTALRLRCPRCHDGKLFSGLLKMHDHCPTCGLKLEPEPGFYLGSIYANYALTVLITTASYVLLVFAAGCNKDTILPGCLVFAFAFPLWFFRYARSIWLSLMYQVNSSDFITAEGHASTDHAGPSDSPTHQAEPPASARLTSIRPEVVAKV